MDSWTGLAALPSDVIGGNAISETPSHQMTRPLLNGCTIKGVRSLYSMFPTDETMRPVISHQAQQ